MVINDHPQIRMQKPFVFAVVRHPYERLVSSYLDFGQTHVMMSSILMIIIVVMIFTWTLRVKCSSLQVKNLSSCLSNIGPLYHPRITPDPTYHILMGWLWCQLSSGDVNDTHKDKYIHRWSFQNWHQPRAINNITIGRNDNSTFICQTTNECSDINKIFDQTGKERASPKQPAR